MFNSIKKFISDKILPRSILGFTLTGSVEWALIPTVIVYTDGYYRLNIDLRFLAWTYGNQFFKKNP